ncbi:tetratricopeptide repeat protein [Chitinophagaceae bacterium MMS25-I14]
MEQLLRWRHKMLMIFLLTCSLQTLGQDSTKATMHNQTWRDSVYHHLFSYSYTSQEWQRFCDTILAVWPENDYIWEMKAMPYIKMGMSDKAYKSLDKAVELNPEKQVPYRGFLKCIFTKDYEGALADFERAEKMVPGAGLMDHHYSFYTGLCYMGLNQPEKALPFLLTDLASQTKQMGKGEEHYNSLFYTGYCYLQLHNYDKAREYLSASLKAYKQFPEANFYMGELCTATNQTDKAAEYYNNTITYIRQGYTMNEDNCFYVNYPFQVGISDADTALALLKR